MNPFFGKILWSMSVTSLLHWQRFTEVEQNTFKLALYFQIKGMIHHYITPVVLWQWNSIEINSYAGVKLGQHSGKSEPESLKC